MPDINSFREFKTEQEAEEWAVKYYPDAFCADINKEPYKSIRYYTGSWYKCLNKILRKMPLIYGDEFDNISPGDYEEEISSAKIINSYLLSFSLPENIVVYRYTKLKNLRNIANSKFLRKGTVLTDKAFTSTTLCKDLLKEFYKQYQCNCLLKIKLPKGSAGAYVSFKEDFSKLNEQEILLPAGMSFKIDKIHYFTFPRVIECTAYIQNYNGGIK